MDDGRPITITQDRYGGGYSGGAWLAWPFLIEDCTIVPWEADGGDGDAKQFWQTWHPVGRGATPDAAAEDLIRLRADPAFLEQLSAWLADRRK